MASHLKGLKKQSRKKSISVQEQKDITKQRRRILFSLFTGIFVLLVCLMCLFALGSIWLKDAKRLERMAELHAGKNEVEKLYANLVAENYKIYNRIRYDNKFIYSLAKSLSAETRSIEEVALKTYVYLRNTVTYIDDNLPKPIFYFPDETFDEKTGNSKEIAILAASLFYYMQIECELIEDGSGHTYLRINNTDRQKYRNAMEKILEPEFLLLKYPITAIADIDREFTIPEHLIGPNLNIYILASELINFVSVHPDQSVNPECSVYSTQHAKLSCTFNQGDVIQLITTSRPIADCTITVSIDRDDLLELIPNADSKGDTDIYMDFTNQHITGLSGKKPYIGNEKIRYPVKPKLLCKI